MGWRVPVFAHIPLIHGSDGAKLSKRHGALGIDSYKKMGFLPETMFSYLLRLGWSYGDEEIELTYVEQLVEISQAKALCDLVQFVAADKKSSGLSFKETLDYIDGLFDKELSSGSGLDCLARSSPNGFYAKPRKLEVAACINRVRTANFE